MKKNEKVYGPLHELLDMLGDTGDYVEIKMDGSKFRLRTITNEEFLNKIYDEEE